MYPHLTIKYSGRYFIQTIKKRHKNPINIENVKLKLESASDINFQEFGNKRTALHFAVLNDLEDFTKELLKVKEINIDVQDNIGFTPLHLAIYNKNEKIIKLLLNNGANTSLEDNRGLNAYGLAKNIGCKYTEVIILNHINKSKKNDKDVSIINFNKRKSIIKSLGKDKRIRGFK